MVMLVLSLPHDVGIFHEQEKNVYSFRFQSQSITPLNDLLICEV